MSTPNTGPDSLRWYSGNEPLGVPLVIGTVTGVVVKFIGSKNPIGAGHLQTADGPSGKTLAYRAPGSSNYGTPVEIHVAGEYLVQDGDDPDLYLIVESFPTFIVDASDAAPVYVNDRYHPPSVGADFKPGGTNPLADQAELRNMHATLAITSAKVWIDPGPPQYLEISDDGVTWVAPTTEGAALDLGSIAQGAAATLHWRRTLTDFTANPKVTPKLHAVFVIDGVTYYSAMYASYRIFEAPEYRFFRSQTGPPVPTDSPFETAAALPHRTTATFADGTWFVSCEYFNGVLGSGFLPLGPNGETAIRLDIVGGAEVLGPPVGPNDASLIEGPNGVVRLQAFCMLPQDPAAPTHWAIGVTTDGTDPPLNTPDYSIAMPASGIAILDWLYPLQILDGVTVKFVLQTIRDDAVNESPLWTYSEEFIRLELTVDTQGPAAPPYGAVWPRPIGEGSPWV